MCLCVVGVSFVFWVSHVLPLSVWPHQAWSAGGKLQEKASHAQTLMITASSPTFGCTERADAQKESTDARGTGKKSERNCCGRATSKECKWGLVFNYVIDYDSYVSIHLLVFICGTELFLVNSVWKQNCQKKRSLKFLAENYFCCYFHFWYVTNKLINYIIYYINYYYYIINYKLL